jgi:phage repressor protein C with HTH and peptisase S24 domain
MTPLYENNDIFLHPYCEVVAGGYVNVILLRLERGFAVL